MCVEPPKPMERRGTVIERIIGEALMKAFSSYSLFCLGVISTTVLLGSQTLDEAHRLERSGGAPRARALLARAAQAAPNDVTAQSEYAEFLDRYGDPGARDAYRKVLETLQRGGDSARRSAVTNRLMTLDLLAGDKTAASAHGWHP